MFVEPFAARSAFAAAFGRLAFQAGIVTSGARRLQAVATVLTRAYLGRECEGTVQGLNVQFSTGVEKIQYSTEVEKVLYLYEWMTLVV